MIDINKTRNKIDEIDEKISELFQLRMDYINDIIDYKTNNSLPIVDKSREKEIIEKNLKYIKDEYKEYYIKFINELMNISKEYQKKKIEK